MIYIEKNEHILLSERFIVEIILKGVQKLKRTKMVILLNN